MELDLSHKHKGEVMGVRRGVVIRSAWKLGREYLFSQQKYQAWSILLAVIFFNLAVVYITVRVNLWQANFYNIIQSHKESGFIEAIGIYLLLAACLVAIKGVQVYLRMLLHINWRGWLTDKYLSLWIKNKTYYRLQLNGVSSADNPDQRISEDVDMFVSLTLRLFLECMQDLLTVISFIVILWNISEVIYLPLGNYEFAIYGYLVWIALLYATIGTFFTVKIGAPLIQLDYNQQKYEADFRFNLIRVREYAESIALYGGEREERINCLRSFSDIAHNFKEIIQIRKQLMWLTSAYAHLAVVFAIFVASPRYFSGKITLGHMFQIIDAFHHVQSGLSFIIDSFTKVAQWRAVVNRLNNFLVCMENSEKNVQQNTLLRNSKGGSLYLAGVNVYKPDGQCLVRNLSLTLSQGSRVLITGPSGCGKSTLLRTIAGLWMYAEGTIAVPGQGNSLFVPQKPYMPIALLREALTYPGLKRKAESQELIEILALCKIGYLAPRLNEHGDWGKFLSLGEQQRMAFARILLHSPDWIFLDEATSALDDENQELMYQTLLTRLPTASICSVGHRRGIACYHKERLVLRRDGTWELQGI